MAFGYYGPRWGQRDKWGRFKCKNRTFQNGGLKRGKKKTDSSKSN